MEESDRIYCHKVDTKSPLIRGWESILEKLTRAQVRTKKSLLSFFSLPDWRTRFTNDREFLRSAPTLSPQTSLVGREWRSDTKHVCVGGYGSKANTQSPIPSAVDCCIARVSNYLCIYQGEALFGWMNGCLIVSRSLVFDYEPCFPVSSFGYHSTVQEDSISWALAYFFGLVPWIFARVFSAKRNIISSASSRGECLSARGINSGQPKTQRLKATKIEP